MRQAVTPILKYAHLLANFRAILLDAFYCMQPTSLHKFGKNKKKITLPFILFELGRVYFIPFFDKTKEKTIVGILLLWRVKL